MYDARKYTFTDLLYYLIVEFCNYFAMIDNELVRRDKAKKMSCGPYF